MMVDSLPEMTPVIVNTENRTLRRRRSAASAALLSRPSMLTLGELVPSFETCVLVYATTTPSSSSSSSQNEDEVRLIYALFEPNFLVDGSSHTVRKLDRTAWERLRSHVEELRIVALSSSSTMTSLNHDDLSSEANRRRKPDCLFDLSTPTDDPSQGTISQKIFLQPQPYTSIPAKSKDDLFEIEIYAPSDAALAEQRKVCLPTQVRAVLHDAQRLMLGNIGRGDGGEGDVRTPASAPANVGGGEDGERRKGGRGVGRGESDFDATCRSILQLVQCPRSDS